MVKVGDKIRILFDGADHANVKRGDEFVVCGVFNCGGIEVEGEYKWLFNNGSYEVISQFKKGDRVIIRDEHNFYNNEVGVIVDIGTLLYGVRLDAGIYTVVSAEQISYYVELEMQVSPVPPQKITQNGYEYSLVGPVKPEWLVDGAWVVNTDNGEKRLVKEERPGVFNLCVDGLASIRYYDGLRNQYRRHEPKDWKWGDWAMYDGKRVFVMASVEADNEVGISFPNADKYGDQSCDKNWNIVSESRLTPTF